MFQAILLIAAFQALFFSVLLITKKSKKLSDKYLFGWLMVLILQILAIRLSMNPPYEKGILWGYSGFCCSMTHGMFLFLYAKSITRSYTTFKAMHTTHLIPCVCCLLIGLIFPKQIDTFIPFIRSLSLVLSLVYIVLSLQTIRKYQTVLTEQYSTTDQLTLNWLKFIIYGLLFFCIGALFFLVTPQLLHFENMPQNELFAVLILAFISVIGFRGLKQSNIFNEKQVVNVLEVPHHQIATPEKTNSYSNYGLKDEDAIKLSECLKVYMEKEKPYLNAELTLKELSESIDTYPHYLSQILNTIFQQNFYDFVNSYRIEEVKKQLLDEKNKHLTILAIAYDCGFNSKSSFNRVFKQRTGVTPSAFVKSAE